MRNKYNKKSKLLFTDNDSLMYENKTEDHMKILAATKKCLILITTRLGQNNMIIKANQSLEK